MTVTRTAKRIQRKKRIRAKIAGTATRPRLAVFRSNKHFYVQLIDDDKGSILAACSDQKLNAKEQKDGEIQAIAKQMAEKIKEKKITNVVFDRGGYKYHGRVRALAEELRAQGIAL